MQFSESIPEVHAPEPLFCTAWANSQEKRKMDLQPGRIRNLRSIGLFPGIVRASRLELWDSQSERAGLELGASNSWASRTAFALVSGTRPYLDVCPMHASIREIFLMSFVVVKSLRGQLRLAVRLISVRYLRYPSQDPLYAAKSVDREKCRRHMRLRLL